MIYEVDTFMRIHSKHLSSTFFLRRRGTGCLSEVSAGRKESPPRTQRTKSVIQPGLRNQNDKAISQRKGGLSRGHLGGGRQGQQKTAEDLRLFAGSQQSSGPALDSKFGRVGKSTRLRISFKQPVQEQENNKCEQNLPGRSLPKKPKSADSLN